MFEIEKELLEKGKKYIIGIDEVGRGALIGDVIVAAVCVDIENQIEGIKDSKRLSEKKRNLLAKEIREKAIAFSIAGAPPSVIDKVNIKRATILSMQNALIQLLEKLKEKGITPDCVLVDAEVIETELECISLAKGDELCYSIGCASIVAKVYRDALCEKWDEDYPGYNLKKHKGYGTKEHRESLVKLGPSPIHRTTFLKKMNNWKDASTYIGHEGEDKAVEYLLDMGYEIIDRNYKIYFGEVDIIAKINEILCFIEVKRRADTDYGYAFEAVTKEKQRKIKLCAEYFVMVNKLANLQPRFDVIEIYNKGQEINHYEDAFQ